MSQIFCENCKRIFKSNQSRNYHIDNDVCREKNHKCKYCEQFFTTKTSMYRHIRESCETKKKNNKHKGDKIEKLEFENKKLRAKINKIEKSKKVSHTTNNYTVNIDNSTKNITNNYITIVAYGKEDLAKIDREDIVKALKTGFKSTKHLAEVVHFNPKYPEYSNIKRNNFNMKKKIMYHDGSSWITTTDPHMIDDFYNRKRDFIEENIEYYRDGLTQGDMTRLQRWLDTNDDDKRIFTVKNELRELLFNKREIAEINEREVVSDKNLDNSNSSDIDDLDIIEPVKIIIKKTSKRKVAPRNGRKRKAIARRSKN
jgi:hypothetical protein